MLKLYYKIWVSLFIKIEKAQNDRNAGLILSLLLLTAANFINCLTIGILLITSFRVRSGLFSDFYSHYRYLSIALIFLVFFLPNYFLLVFNKKHQLLMELYQKDNKKNLGFNYFVISASIVFLLIFSTILFPAFFGLKSAV